jgi:hypothetical protein
MTDNEIHNNQESDHKNGISYSEQGYRYVAPVVSGWCDVKWRMKIWVLHVCQCFMFIARAQGFKPQYYTAVNKILTAGPTSLQVCYHEALAAGLCISLVTCPIMGNLYNWLREPGGLGVRCWPPVMKVVSSIQAGSSKDFSSCQHLSSPFTRHFFCDVKNTRPHCGSEC